MEERLGQECTLEELENKIWDWSKKETNGQN